MKRKPILFAIALLLVVGATLWGVNYRLDHPPLTKADKEFRAIVEDADRVLVIYISKPFKGTSTIKKENLNAEQTHELIEQIRFLEWQASQTPMPTVVPSVSLLFMKGNHPLHGYNLYQTRSASRLLVVDSPDAAKRLNMGGAGNAPKESAQVHPRFHKRLNRALDAYLPQRIRP